MSNPPRSLNATIDGFKLLGHLGHPTPTAALPCPAVCPLCRLGTIKLYEDHASGGQWFHCGDCRRYGDLIELASAVWGLSRHATILKLKCLGYDLPEDAAAARWYVEAHPAPRRRAHALWNLSRKRWKKLDFGLNQLIWKLRLHSDTSLARRPEGPGQLFGGVHKSDVERCFAPRSMRHADRRSRQSNPSAHAVFRGPGWDEVLVIPYYDLPGRISAFLLVGRDGDPVKDTVFKVINRSFRGNQHAPAVFEAGLGMHPRTLEAADGFGRTLIAYHNPLVTLPLQVRHFAQSLLPLPLVAWQDSVRERPSGGQPNRVRTHHAWQLLGNRRLVLWMPAFRLETLRQAIEQDACLSTAGPVDADAKSFQQYLWRQRPAELCHHIAKTARPWSEVLSSHLEQLTDQQLESLYYRLGAEGLDAEQVFAKCGHAASGRIGGIAREPRQRTARLGGRAILERGGHWLVKRSKTAAEELITDAVVRVDKVLHRGDGNPFLLGRVVYRGQEYPFTQQQSAVQLKGMHWVRDHLVSHGIGPPRCDFAWSRRLVELAELFHSPRVIPVVERMGWDADHASYVPRLWHQFNR